MELRIKEYLMERLIEPLKYYNTSTQDTLLELVSLRLQELYDTAKDFTDIIDIDEVSEYLLEEVAKSLGHTLEKARPLTESRAVIDNIVETHRRRGSIESLENMSTYYGDHLPKDITVKIPSYDLFRYSVSPYSGTHRFKDGKYWRAGIVELIIRDDFDLDKLRAFVVKELIAAGTEVLFSRESSMGDEIGLGPIQINVINPLGFELLLSIELMMVSLRSGMQYSTGIQGFSGSRSMSGKQTLFLETMIETELYTSMTRKREESAFILNPIEIVEYFEYPAVKPMNLLSGFPVIGTTVYLDDSRAVGLESEIGSHRSYDYLHSAYQLIWDLYPQRVSSHGRMSGKNSLSGPPVSHEHDKSWNPLKYFPTTLDKLYERSVDKKQEIIKVNMDLALKVDEDTLIYFDLKTNLYIMGSTLEDINTDVRINLTDVNDNPVPLAPAGNYPGYFVLATTPLGGYMLESQEYNGSNKVTIN